MCGIISYIGIENCIPNLIGGIKKLEYRGYDSFGCAVVVEGKIVAMKDIGSINSNIEKYKISEFSSNLAAFHTRWATHGGITLENAHPQLDCAGKIAVVHNGIIENYEDMREKLTNHYFLSETDTEIIPHMIENKIMKGAPFYEAVMSTAKELKGSSSFVAISSDVEEMVAVKVGSPLIIGVAEKGYFVSSDVPSVLDYTNRIIYLSDGDLIHITKQDYKIHNIFGLATEHKIYTINPKYIDMDLGHFSHYMEKEIYDQLNLWKPLRKTIFSKINAASAEISRSHRVYLIGSGSSFHVCLFGAMLIRESGIDALAMQPHEIQNFVKIIQNDDILIIVSQSGETADIIHYLRLIPDNRKIGIINVEHSQLTRKVDILLPMSVGIERGVAATKSVTNSMLILTYLKYALLGRTKEIETNENLLELNKFSLVVPSIEHKIDEVAHLLFEEKTLFVVGSGICYALALEAALKIKEVTYIHAEAIDLVSLKHGPLAMIESGTKVIVILNEDEYVPNVDEIKARGAYIIGISEKRLSNYDQFIRMISVGNLFFAPVLFVVQLIAYKIALLKGIDPDKPRNLAKSVTVR